MCLVGRVGGGGEEGKEEERRSRTRRMRRKRQKTKGGERHGREVGKKKKRMRGIRIKGMMVEDINGIMMGYGKWKQAVGENDR